MIRLDVYYSNQMQFHPSFISIILSEQECMERQFKMQILSSKPIFILHKLGSSALKKVVIEKSKRIMEF